MGESTKIEFRYRRVAEIRDITDLVAMLFPDNCNQQYAAAWILVELKSAPGLVPNMAHLEREHGISRRTLQRARAKLSRLGLIERVGFLNRRFHGEVGWRLSRRMGSAMRQLAEIVDSWQHREAPDKDRALVSLLR